METKHKTITITMQEENYIFIQALIAKNRITVSQWANNVIAKEKMLLEYEDIINDFHPSKLDSWDELKDPRILRAWELWQIKNVHATYDW